MLYTKERFDVKVVLLRIAILQTLFYAVLAVTLTALVAPYYIPLSTTSPEVTGISSSWIKAREENPSTSSNLISIVFDWTCVRYTILYNFQGIMAASAYALTSLIMAFCIWKVTKRSSKCADFSCTIYLIHALACWLYNKDGLGFPTSIHFWVCMIVSGVTTAVIAERLCMREELEDIPLASFVHQTTEQDTILEMQSGRT